MKLITNEVYDYMLSEVQQEAVAGYTKMKTIITHLQLRAEEENVKLKPYVEVAEEIEALLRRAATKIDNLPVLGIDLEELVGIKEPQIDEDTVIIRTISHDQAIDLVGRRMTLGGMTDALLEHFTAEKVQHNVADNTFTIYTEKKS